MATMETLQLAQMLADLSDLNAAQESRAAALLEANRNQTLSVPIPPTVNDDNSSTVANPPTSNASSTTGKLAENRHHQRVASTSAILSRAASPAKFDKFGRRILTPPLTRNNSYQGSGTGTPHHPEHDDDVNQANTLMALYEIRAKLRQQESTSLSKVREKVFALQNSRHNSVPQSPVNPTNNGTEARRSPYTFPKST